jgi:hypothetical protein
VILIQSIRVCFNCAFALIVGWFFFFFSYFRSFDLEGRQGVGTASVRKATFNRFSGFSKAGGDDYLLGSGNLHAAPDERIRIIVSQKRIPTFTSLIDIPSLPSFAFSKNS